MSHSFSPSFSFHLFHHSFLCCYSNSRGTKKLRAVSNSPQLSWNQTLPQLFLSLCPQLYMPWPALLLLSYNHQTFCRTLWYDWHSTDASLTFRENIDETCRSTDWATVKKWVLTEYHISSVAETEYKPIVQSPSGLCLFTVCPVNRVGEATDKILMTSVISVGQI